MAQNQNKRNNNPKMNMPRPSLLWVYGVIAALIVGYYLFNPSNDRPLESDWSTVREMVERGDVTKIQVINRDEAQVFLSKEAADRYRNDSVDKRFRRLPESGAQLTFTIGSVDSFREDLQAAEAQSGQDVPVVYFLHICTGDTVCGSLCSDNIKQRLPFFLGQLLGIVYSINRFVRVQDHRCGIHRTRQRPSSGLVHSAQTHPLPRTQAGVKFIVCHSQSLPTIMTGSQSD